MRHETDTTSRPGNPNVPQDNDELKLPRGTGRKWGAGWQAHWEALGEVDEEEERKNRVPGALRLQLLLPCPTCGDPTDRCIISLQGACDPCWRDAEMLE